MTTIDHPNGIAPVSSGQYQLGAKGGRMAKAWQDIWDQLSRDDWRDSLSLAEAAAVKHGLKKVTVTEMLCRMRASGVLDQEMIPMPTEYTRKRGRKDGETDADYAKVKTKTFTANRPRVHYRIAAGS